MLVICETNPNKEYQIEKIGNVYFCYPQTEAEYLELLFCYNGNNIQSDLNLYNTYITELPDNLTVEGYLDLGNTNITELPNNLTVNGYLYLNYTNIISLPDNLTVGGDLYLRNTKLPKDYSIPIGVKGKVYR